MAQYPMAPRPMNGDQQYSVASHDSFDQSREGSLSPMNAYQMENPRDRYKEVQRAGSLATFLGGAPKRKNTVISKPTQGFQDLDEDEFAEKQRAQRILAYELRQ